MTTIPTTWDELHAAGYRFERRTFCRYCPTEIEWFTTPSGKWMPLEKAPEMGGIYVSHWGTCTGAQQAKKDKADSAPAKLTKKQERAAKKREHSSSTLFEI